jgi:hypothetical protein
LGEYLKMRPSALAMLRSYHGRVVPATTHRVAEVRKHRVPAYVI